MQIPQIHPAELKPNELSKLLPTLSDESCERLQRLLRDPAFSGCIAATDVKFLADEESKSVDALMPDLLPLARTYSRPPISNYLVGAVVRGVSGNLYLGANLEIPGHSLGFSVHGEQSAIANAYMHGDKAVSVIAVTAAPCGHCRQFMNELSPVQDIDVLVHGSPATRLSALLPASFGPRNLGSNHGAFPVREAALVVPKVSDDLTNAAFDAARKSYAPYTKSHSGVAVATHKGRIFSGPYIENAAFNPSLSPLQTALVALIFSGGSLSDISHAALVEVDGATISQKSVTEAVLSAIAPSVKLQLETTRMKT